LNRDFARGPHDKSEVWPQLMRSTSKMLFMWKSWSWGKSNNVIVVAYYRWNSWTKLASPSKHIETPQPISPIFLMHRLLQPCTSHHSPCRSDANRMQIWINIGQWGRQLAFQFPMLLAKSCGWCHSFVVLALDVVASYSFYQDE
jgi:hypothetical protein